MSTICMYRLNACVCGNALCSPQFSFSGLILQIHLFADNIQGSRRSWLMGKGLLTSKGRGEWEGAEFGGSRGMVMLGALYGDGPPDRTARGE